MDDAERLESIFEALDRLTELSADHTVLVEGRKDVEALEHLGFSGDVFCVQISGGPVKAAEYAWRQGKSAVILTDWDRKGDILAESLRENLSSLGTGYDDSVRRDLSFLCRPYCKDVESLDSVVSLLEGRAESSKH